VAGGSSAGALIAPRRERWDTARMRGKPRKSRWCGQLGLPSNTARIFAGWP